MLLFIVVGIVIIWFCNMDMAMKREKLRRGEDISFRKRRKRNL